MEETVRKSPAPFYAVAVVWLVYALLFPLYKPLHYVLLGAASVVVFLVVNRLCRSGPIGQEKKAEETKKAEAPKEDSTGDPALDKMLKDGRLAIAEMKRLDDTIADPGISADIVRLEQVSAKIFEEVKRDPKKLPQIRKFMDYYLPTTLKILRAYSQLEDQEVSGENITSAMERIEGMMDKVVEGFEKQLDQLFQGDAMDITTDVEVLERMLAKDGLSDRDGMTLNL